MRSGSASGRPRRREAPPRPWCVQGEFEAGEGRHRVWGTALVSPGGLSVTLVGGDLPHIGAVAISLPRPSRKNPNRRSATTSVFTLVGHKEDELARPFAAALARALGLTSVVAAGVHIEGARPADLARVFENAGRALEAIIARVKADPGYRRRVGADHAPGTGRTRSPARRGRKTRRHR